jgi:hypothetical protein
MTKRAQNGMRTKKPVDMADQFARANIECAYGLDPFWGNEEMVSPEIHFELIEVSFDICGRLMRF